MIEEKKELNEQEEIKSLEGDEPEVGPDGGEGGVEKRETDLEGGLEGEKEKGIEDIKTLEKEIETEEAQVVQTSFLRSTPKELSDVLTMTQAAREIEDILTAGLDETYKDLPEELKDEFREQGIITVSNLEKIMNEVQVTVKKVFDLIRKWLHLIPKANQYFLEQESKIKTDKIIQLAKQTGKDIVD